MRRICFTLLCISRTVQGTRDICQVNKCGDYGAPVVSVLPLRSWDDPVRDIRTRTLRIIIGRLFSRFAFSLTPKGWGFRNWNLKVKVKI